MDVERDGLVAVGRSKRTRKGTSPGRRRARRPRWPRRASGPASPASRAPPGEPTARVLAGYRRTPRDRGRGQARPFGAADLATVLATCNRPRHRGRGFESEEVARERGPPRRRDRGTPLHGGCRRNEVSDASLGRGRRRDRRRRAVGHRPPASSTGSAAVPASNSADWRDELVDLAPGSPIEPALERTAFDRPTYNFAPTATGTRQPHPQNFELGSIV